MTDSTPDPSADRHLDDERLSVLVDDSTGDGSDHAGGCPTCGARLLALQGARDALASADVAALDPLVVERMVTRAVAEADAVPAGVTSLASVASGRRLTTPPPSWLAAAAAALVVVAGIAGLVRSSSPSDDAGTALTSGSLKPEERAADETTAVAADAAGAAAALAVDPELVSFDLGEHQDEAVLAAVLATRPQVGSTVSQLGAARSSAGGDDADRFEGAGGESTTTGRIPGGSGSAPPAADRAQCRTAAEEAGRGRFAQLEWTATVRWNGQRAEVLVFRLVQPAPEDGLTRQAMVLRRPGCALLADPRF